MILFEGANVCHYNSPFRVLILIVVDSLSAAAEYFLSGWNSNYYRVVESLNPYCSG